jgi:hypothetical protein
MSGESIDELWGLRLTTEREDAFISAMSSRYNGSFSQIRSGVGKDQTDLL